MLPSQYLDAYQRVIGFGNIALLRYMVGVHNMVGSIVNTCLHRLVLEISLYYITWLGLSSILIYTYTVTMAMDGRLKASVVIHVVTMAMDGRLKASVVIWSVEAHESQEVDHAMRRGPNIGISSFSIVYYYTSHRPTVSIVYCNWCESCYNKF